MNDDDKKGNLAHAKCYVHFRRELLHNFEIYGIQYWFFYPFNGTMSGGGAHEGDWEHITVRTTEGKSIRSIYCSAHEAEEGRWYNPNVFELTEEGRPIIYSAKHSHANYPTAGKQARDGGVFGLPDDYTKKGGPKWNCWEDLLLLGEKEHIINGQYWLKFNGGWGMIGGILGPVTPSGPVGPAMKPSWYTNDWKGEDIAYVPPQKDRIKFYEGNNCNENVIAAITIKVTDSFNFITI